MRLNSVLQSLMLRRNKTDSRGSGPLVNLPPKTVEISILNFTPEEQAAYASTLGLHLMDFNSHSRVATVHCRKRQGSNSRSWKRKAS